MWLSLVSFTREGSVKFKTISIITKYFPQMFLKIGDIKRHYICGKYFQV